MRPQLIEVPLKDAGMTVAQATAQSVYLYLLPADNGRINVENVNAMVEQLGRSFIPSEGHMFSAGHIVSIEEGNGAYRLMFSCPDALPLAKTLKKYLDEMKWTGTYRIMMRLGKYYDDVVAKELAEA
jgi:riboflavin synthase alpha subunit